MTMSGLVRNRLLYGSVLALALGLTWIYGGRMLYVFLYTLCLLPGISYGLTFILLHGLRVTQKAEQVSVVKAEPGRYTLTIRNYTPLMYDNIVCLFVDDHFAVEAERPVTALFARPFMRVTHTVLFRVKYRGTYRLGLRALQVNDLMGLFTLKRRLKDTIELTVLPRVLEISYFPLAANLLSQSHSNFEIREEDYSTVSDIRPYEPTDSMKRVHWKLTAKRNEWMVKNFQSNALNRITVIMDTARLPMPYEEALPLEDRMIETALAVLRYCLYRQMPVEFIVGEGVRKTGRLPGDFDAIYQVAAGLVFEATQEQSKALALLDKCLNETASYINVVIATAKPDGALYERIVNANHAGHFVALLYFAAVPPDPHAEQIFQRLEEGGAACYRITEDDNPAMQSA